MSKKKTFLDYTTEFNDFEKKILKQIHKMYKDKNIMEYKVWDVAIDFIEQFGLGYKEAYELSNSYYYNKDYLFNEYRTYKKVSANSYIFFENFNKFIERFFSSEMSKFENIDLRFKGDNIDLENAVNVQTLYKGFYVELEPIEIDDENEYYNWRYRNNRIVRFNINFHKIDLNGEKTDKYYYSDEESKFVDQNKFLVEIEIKYGYSDDSNNILIKKYIDYPEKLTLENIFKLFRDVINDSLSEVKTNTLKIEPLKEY